MSSRSASQPEMVAARTETVEGTRATVHLAAGTWWRVVALDGKAARRARHATARRLVIDPTPPKLKTGKPDGSESLERSRLRLAPRLGLLVPRRRAGAARRHPAGAGAARPGRAAHLGQAAARGQGGGAPRAGRRRARRSPGRRAPLWPTPLPAGEAHERRALLRFLLEKHQELTCVTCSTAREAAGRPGLRPLGGERRRRREPRAARRPPSSSGKPAGAARLRLLSVAARRARCWSPS